MQQKAELKGLFTKYKVFSKDVLIPERMADYHGQRELLASLDLKVAELADIFIGITFSILCLFLFLMLHETGNSVSTLSAMTILHRRDRNLPAMWYNGGDIPLQYFVPPLFTPPKPMKW